MKPPSPMPALRLCTLTAALIMSGCAAPIKRMERDEFLAATSRIYRAPKAQVLSAAEQVLKLADGDDVVFTHNREGFTAQRFWTVYLVLAASFGTDFWVLKTSEQGDLLLVELQVGTSAQAVAPMATTNPNTWTATSLPANAMPVTGPALYELFFARLDYMLGLRPDWPTCAWSDRRLSDKATYGGNEQLCNSFNMKDLTPKGPMVQSVQK